MLSNAHDESAAHARPATRSSSPVVGGLLVLLAASLWGTLPIGLKLMLRETALSTVGLAHLRAAVAFVLLAGGLALVRPRLLRVDRRDLPYLAAYAAIGIALFYALYAEAVARNSVAVAVVLLYTSPAWVTLIAWRVFGEPLSRSTLVALGCAFAGAALVAGVADPRALAASLPGVLAGLGSGLAWALYTILGKRALGRYSPWTVLAYVLGLGSLFLAAARLLAAALPGVAADSGPGAGAAGLLAELGSLGAAGWAGVLLLALGPTLGALGAYTEGLRRLPASVTSILSTWEPAVGALLGYLLLGETLAPLQLLGAALILAGVLLLGLAGSRGRSRRSPALGSRAGLSPEPHG